MENLPDHLKKYIVEQNYNKYTPVDHSVWRYILKQLKDFLSVNAHESYLEGLEKTGISLDEIPKISDISEKLKQFGWRAMPVSGFIPPAAFMEMQSLGILPIASDMRSISHLMYTPAPDIVHEAAGHAPILIHPEFAEYLRQYAQVARKAIISKEDLEIYEAIRILSDLKENPNSTAAEIHQAEKRLAEISKNISHVSEAAELSRMNWWTAEYGLIGDLNNPKIFGAGLLSSVGESKRCLDSHVKKIPLSVDCLKTSYDITEPQPQLFVARDFKHLQSVLEEMAAQMAFRVGGTSALDKAIQAESVNTVELDSELQISGIVKSYKMDTQNRISYLQLQGPTQLAYHHKEIPGHSKTYHRSGYGTALGLLNLDFFKIISEQIVKKLTLDDQLEKIDLETPLHLNVQFDSGLKVQGKLLSAIAKKDKILLVSFSDCAVSLNAEILFEPAWGIYDMALAQAIPSVYAGPADRKAYGETEDFVAARVPAAKYTAEQMALHHLYEKMSALRKSNSSISAESLDPLYQETLKKFPHEWLLILEIYELATKNKLAMAETVLKKLMMLSDEKEYAELIREGVRLYS